MILPHRSGTFRAVDSLDGIWSCSIDPEDKGIVDRWQIGPREDAHPISVPGILEQAFPGYHGVAWYWCQFIPARNPHPMGRHLLRFESVDFRAEVWVNAERISDHDGAQSPFVLDITDSVRPGEKNILAVRVVNPTEQPIDGLVLSQIPHRNKSIEPTIGSSFNHGGIIGSVEVLCRPAIYIAELVAKPDPRTGILRVLTLVLNTLESAVPVNLKFTVASAIGGETLQAGNTSRTLQPGQTLFETQVPISAARLWDVDDPFLYRLTARVLPDAGGRGDEVSTRFGFRDFQFDGNHFRLNGRRLFWKCARTLNNYPHSQALPPDMNWLQRELILIKTMGFNAVRFMAGLALPAQLDWCDELGLLVYEESYAAMGMLASDQLDEHFDRSLRQMILRDRNHPSVVIWGLLTDTSAGAVFRHAVELLPRAAFLDETRLVALNSGRFDDDETIQSLSRPGSAEWNALPASGDQHLHVSFPMTSDESRRIRSLGESHDHPIWISDCQIPGGVDLLALSHDFEMLGQSHGEDARLMGASLESLLRDWERWQMNRAFSRPEEFFRRATVASDQRRLAVISALRANPRVMGLTLGLADDFSTGSGVLGFFRQPRPTAGELAEHLSPLRWCLSVEPANPVLGQTVTIDAVLANDNALTPGVYPVCLQVLDGSDHAIFEERAIIEIKSDANSPLAVSALRADVSLNGAAGEHRVIASFEHGALAACDELIFSVFEPVTQVSLSGDVWIMGHHDPLSRWLAEHGIASAELGHASQPAPGDRILAVHPRSREQTGDDFDHLLRLAEAGAHVIILSCEFFGTDHRWLSAGELATIASLRETGDPVDAWAISHPIFSGLADRGLLDERRFSNLLPTCGLVDLDASGQVLAAAHRTRMHPDEYRSAVLLARFPHGRGSILLNAFKLLDHLSKDVVADRLLSHFLQFAADPFQ